MANKANDIIKTLKKIKINYSNLQVLAKSVLKWLNTIGAIITRNRRDIDKLQDKLNYSKNEQGTSASKEYVDNRISYDKDLKAFILKD